MCVGYTGCLAIPENKIPGYFPVFPRSFLRFSRVFLQSYKADFTSYL